MDTKSRLSKTRSKDKHESSKKKEASSNGKEGSGMISSEEAPSYATKQKPQAKKFKRLKKTHSATSEDMELDKTRRRSREADDKFEGQPLEDIAEEDAALKSFIVEIGDKGNELKESKLPASIRDIRDAKEMFSNRRKTISKMNSREEIELDSYASEKYICYTDIPERMQELKESTVPPSSDGREAESSWIFDQLPLDLLPQGTVSDDCKRDIAKFLDLYHIQKLEVPFVYMYRKEDCPSLVKDPGQYEPENGNPNNSDKNPTLRWHKVFWAILDVDKKWLLFQEEKAALDSCLRKELSRDDCDDMDRKLLESVNVSLMAANAKEEVADVRLKFNLHFPEGKKNKKPSTRDGKYSRYKKNGLWKVGRKFVYSKQFGLQISENMRVEELEDLKETPEKIASEFTCPDFPTPEAVLLGAKYMAAVALSCEPSVRKHFRNVFMANATVSTKPGINGTSLIGSAHQLSGVNCLKDKPLKRFEKAQWLLIQKAEEEKLIEVIISLPEVILTKLIDNYSPRGVGQFAQLWNEQRKQISEDAFKNHLSPNMIREARVYLASEATRWVLMEYGSLLWERVSVAPYQRKENDIFDEEVPPRVMACCMGPEKSATFVMLNSSGEVHNVLSTHQHWVKHDKERVRTFMMDNRPHVVVVGASCKSLKRDIYEIHNMIKKNPGKVGQEMDNLHIVYGDETLPHLYANSFVKENPESRRIKRAVALGRYLQNPLAMIATLCGPKREILFWKLTPFDSYVTEDEKYAMVEQVMVDVTNQVGFDVKLAASHEWLCAPLQFISGLGPRKAGLLQKYFRNVGVEYFKRNDILSTGMGKTVSLNAGGFLRVRRSACSSNLTDLLNDTEIYPHSINLIMDDLTEFLDDTRIHPESYDAAIKVLRENPTLLHGMTGKDEELRLKMLHGSWDCRRPFEELSDDVIFRLISGESEETLSEGMIIRATICRVDMDF